MAPRARPGQSWQPCPHPGCSAVGIGTGGECLAHLDEKGLRLILAEIEHGRPLDARGVTVSSDLLGRVLSSAPTDPDGRSVLRAARFDKATFCESADFGRVVFAGDVFFDRAEFAGHASFAGARFAYARFGRATFAGSAGFRGVEFDGHAWFAGARFREDASFSAAEFRGPAWFGGATFRADADFTEARFANDASFDDADFRCHTVFVSASFDGELRLDRASFATDPLYTGAAFRGRGGAPQGAVGQAVWTGAALAPWRARVGAALVDALVPSALGAAAVALTALLGLLRYEGLLPYLLAAAGAVGAGFTIRNLVDQGQTGQTLGKRHVGLSLVRQRDGLPAGAAVSIARYLLHAVDTGPLLLGWLWPLWDTRRQTFSDKITSTVVVRRAGWARPGSSDPIGGRGPEGCT